MNLSESKLMQALEQKYGTAARVVQDPAPSKSSSGVTSAEVEMSVKEVDDVP